MQHKVLYGMVPHGFQVLFLSIVHLSLLIPEMFGPAHTALRTSDEIVPIQTADNEVCAWPKVAVFLERHIITEIKLLLAHCSTTRAMRRGILC